MANIGKWNSPSGAVTVLATELNSLVNGSICAASSAVANNTNLDIYADIECFFNTLSPTTGAYVVLYAMEAVDGSTYPAPSAADLRLATSQVLCSMPIGVTASTPQRVVARNVVLPPASFKIIMDNQTGATLNSTGNTVKLMAYDVNLNG